MGDPPGRAPGRGVERALGTMAGMSSPRTLRPLALSLAALLALAACSTGAPAAPAQSGQPTSGTPSQPAPAASPSSSESASAAASASASPSSGQAPLAVVKNADGTCTMPAKYAGKDFETLPTGSARKIIALTFDGGASNAADARILRILREKNATATFFFTGKFAELYPDTVREIAASYPIGNHSYSHPRFVLDKLSDAQMAKQIADGEAAILKASGGVSPAPFFRFPEGDVNANAIKQVNKACYVPFRWTIDTIGYAGLATNSKAKIVAKVLAKATPSGVILMHQGDNPNDGSQLDADALPEIIDGLRAKGYEFVTLREALAAS